VKGRFLIPPALVLALAVLSGGGRPAPARVERLDEVLTNRISDIPELRRMDEAVDSFMQFWSLHGVSLSIMRNDSLVYAKGYGMAGPREPMTPGTTLRMASVSKLLTAVAIMKLQEEGRVFLDTPVFGPFGVLNGYDPCIKDDNYFLITVEHLLRHQAGFSTRGGDPLFSPHTGTREDLVRRELAKPLDFLPGSDQKYSNLGYLLLSLIVEKVTGVPYERYMQEEILEPMGCHDFRIGGNYLKDRHPGETRYYMQPDAVNCSSFDGKYASVEKCYGGNDIPLLSGAGAWTGSAPELSRLVAHIDGLSPVEDILSEYTVRQMTRYFDEDTFCLGWVDCRPDGEWTRTGSFSGTSALIKVYPDGECWILLSNTSSWRGSRFTKDVAALFRNLRSRFSAQLPRRDLFQEQPTLQR